MDTIGHRFQTVALVDGDLLMIGNCRTLAIAQATAAGQYGGGHDLPHGAQTWIINTDLALVQERHTVCRADAQTSEGPPAFHVPPATVETDQTANREAIATMGARDEARELFPTMGAPTGLATLLAIGQGRNVSRSYEARS